MLFYREGVLLLQALVKIDEGIVPMLCATSVASCTKIGVDELEYVIVAFPALCFAFRDFIP